MTLTFTSMQTQHLPGAMRMSSEVKWPHRIEDWAFALDISRGVVALHDGKVVATALSTPYGSSAMSNLIIVDPSMRGRKLGRKVMERAMATIDPATWHLVATPDGLPLYEKLGFCTIGEVSQHQGVVASVDPMGEATWGNSTHLPAIIELDRAASGMDRTSLYTALSKTTRFAVAREDANITGFAAIREFGRGKVIGPVVAPSIDEAKSLISFVMSNHLGQFLRVDTDTDLGLGPWLKHCGLPKTGSGVRMQKGQPMTTQATPVTVFALASQALG